MSSPLCFRSNGSTPVITPTPALDRSALLAALQTTGKAKTSLGFAFRSVATIGDQSRPYACAPYGEGITTWHESPALAIARLVSL